MVSCSGDKTLDSNPSTLNWVGTEVLYRPVDGKRDHSLLFVLHASCGWCQKLKSETLTDPDVVRMLGESFNIAQLDMAVDTAVVYFDSTVSSLYLGRTIYGVNQYPTIIALDCDGAELGHAVGFREPDEFVELLELILELIPDD